MRDFSIEIIE